MFPLQPQTAPHLDWTGLLVPPGTKRTFLLTYEEPKLLLYTADAKLTVSMHDCSGSTTRVAPRPTPKP